MCDACREEARSSQGQSQIRREGLQNPHNYQKMGQKSNYRPPANPIVPPMKGYSYTSDASTARTEPITKNTTPARKKTGIRLMNFEAKLIGGFALDKIVEMFMKVSRSGYVDSLIAKENLWKYYGKR